MATTHEPGQFGLLAEVRLLLASSRLVVLTGPGGIGKMRMAIEAARREPDAVWWT